MNRARRSINIKHMWLLTAAAVLAVMGLAQTVGAAPVVSVTPYENLPKTQNVPVAVTVNGLYPNQEVMLTQVAMQNYDTGTTSGVWVEQLPRGIYDTGDTGSISVATTVHYDVRTDMTNFDYCDNDATLLRLCYLDIKYAGGDYAGEVVAQFKLYFGVAAPGNGGGNGGGGEEEVVLTKEACKKDGWRQFSEQHGFKNQGQCISYVVSRS